MVFLGGKLQLVWLREVNPKIDRKADKKSSRRIDYSEQG